MNTRNLSSLSSHLILHHLYASRESSLLTLLTCARAAVVCSLAINFNTKASWGDESVFFSLSRDALVSEFVSPSLPMMFDNVWKNSIFNVCMRNFNVLETGEGGAAAVTFFCFKYWFSVQPPRDTVDDVIYLVCAKYFINVECVYIFGTMISGFDRWFVVDAWGWEERADKSLKCNFDVLKMLLNLLKCFSNWKIRFFLMQLKIGKFWSYYFMTVKTAAGAIFKNKILLKKHQSLIKLSNVNLSS